MSYYHTLDHSISLNPIHRNVATVLHEVAHAIQSYILGDVHEDHGPEWLGIFMWLLVKAGVASEEAIILTAQHHKLCWRTTAYIGPKSIRKRYRKLARLARH